MSKQSDQRPVVNEFVVKQWRAPDDRYYTTVSRLNKRKYPETVITTADPVVGAETGSSALNLALIEHIGRIAGEDLRPPQDRV